VSITYRPFTSAQESHLHSLETLESLYQFDDFMGSIRHLADMGCGEGLDLEWWATRTTRDAYARPLDIRCTGIDTRPNLSIAHRIKNIVYQPQDFRDPIRLGKHKFDVIWCHDAFQFVNDPFSVLKNWRQATNQGGMLILVLPQTTVMKGHTQAFEQWDGCYWHWTMVNLIHVLAVSGWDCSGGFFRKQANDPWLTAVVYRSEHEPLDPSTARWYDLCALGLLPHSAVQSVEKYGYLRQQDLVLPWIDKSLTWLQQQ